MKKITCFSSYNFVFIFLCLAIVIFNHSTSTAQSGWYTLNSGTGRLLNGLYFVNSNTGWVVGDSIVLKTVNGGINWVTQTLPAQTRNSSVYFLNENTGFIVGDKNYLSYTYGIYTYKTTNGGTTWSTVNINIPPVLGTAYTYDILAINENILFKTHGEFPGFSGSGAIHKSINGGINFSNSLEDGVTKGLSFLNAQTGWTTSTTFSDLGVIKYKTYKTTDGGNSWIIRDSMNRYEGRVIKFLNDSIGYVLAAGITTKIFRTTNGGTSWIKDSLGNTKYNAMCFANTSTGWIAGYQSGGSTISRTTNGGLNWIDQFPAVTTALKGIYFVDAFTGWAVGFNGLILKTITGGATSVIQTSSEISNLFSLYQNFPNPFNSSTNIKFQCPTTGNAKLIVYDILGKEIITLVNEKLQVGEYEISFDGSNLSSGVYFYKLISGDYSNTKRMLMIK